MPTAAMTFCSNDTLRQIAKDYGTPVYVYHAEGFLEQLHRLSCFDRVRFAQKACPNIHIQRLLREAGASVDCVSFGELQRAIRAGYETGPDRSDIVYTADVLTREALDEVVRTGVAVNAGSEDMLSQLGGVAPGHRVWLRVNPGFGHGHSQKVNTGGESSKHGIWHENIPAALRLVERHGLNLVGLHMHIGSGADQVHLTKVCDAMARQVKSLGCDLQAISGGGGLSIPYRSGDPTVDVAEYYRKWNAARQSIEQHLGHHVELEIEPGRYIAGPNGLLVAEVLATKSMGRNYYALLDAGFNDLVRPAMYGAYHEISVVPRAADRDVAAETTRPTIVAGPLCESGDVFTQIAGGEVESRDLPSMQLEDLVVFHDAGAYGASMSSNYNSRPHAPEVLVGQGKTKLIRRRQSVEDLLALEEL